MAEFMPAHWESSDPALVTHLENLSQQSLDSYRVNPSLVDEQANMEVDLAEGGYGKRQVFELVQNGADAMVGGVAGRVHILLTGKHLYCANEGSPVDGLGLGALLRAFLSVKREDEIGRFGLGFKSVLGVTDKPEFFCRAVSFGFDAARSKAKIQQIVPNAARYPILRLAHLLDPLVHAEADADLRDLMSWATTIVRLERNVGESAWLHEDLKAFPSPFLLFCSTVSSLTLQDRVRGTERDIRIERTGRDSRLIEGGGRSTWRVFSKVHSPSPAARADAGKLAGRDRLPIHWALPMTGGTSVGEFWAFFPLVDRTTLSGVVNAPWKTNDDRTSLLEGAFNQELLTEVATLVVRNLDEVTKEGDPGWHLDVLPARGREARGWADDFLTTLTYDIAARSASLPDQAARLRKPGEVRLHPRGIPSQVLNLWSAEPARPVDWCHASIETRDRRPRVERLFEIAKQDVSALPDWIQALFDGKTPERCNASIKVAAELVRQVPAFADDAQQFWILIDSKGKPAATIPDRIFLPPADGQAHSNKLRLVHPAIAQDESLREHLAILGIVPVTPELELSQLLVDGIVAWRDPEWDTFWSLVRMADQEKAVRLISEVASYRSRIKVRTLAGSYKPVHLTLLPGPIVPSDGSRDSEVTIDVKHHESEASVITRIGGLAAPAPEQGLPEDEVFQRYERECVESYIASLPPDSPQPQPEKLGFSRSAFTGPLEPLQFLSDEGRAKFADTLMRAERDLGEWTLFHQTQARYPRKKFMHPVVWAIRQSGRLPTNLGPRPVARCLHPSLTRFASLTPVAQCATDIADALRLPASWDSLDAVHWHDAFDEATRLTDDRLLGEFYAEAARQGLKKPQHLNARVGYDHRVVEANNVTVVTSQRELDALVSVNKPVLLANGTDASLLIDKWSLHPAEKSVRTELSFVASGPSSPLLDRFPALRLRTNTDHIAAYEILACSELRLETLTEAGKTNEQVRVFVKGTTIHWIDVLTEIELLDEIGPRLGLSLSPEDRDAILEERAAHRQLQRLKAVRSVEGSTSKLLKAVGIDAIRSHIPISLVQAVEARHGSLTDHQTAELAETIFGVTVLQEFRSDLEAKGFEPPQKWAGSRAALQFVRKLGLGSEYAGTEEERYPDLLRVEGPTVLPPLHDFQLDITARVKRLFRSAETRRGLLSLPTGAGKTRIVVQALIDEIREANLGGPILWVAQSEELCEQAVQTFAEVWHAVGPKRRLYINRLWSQNEAEYLQHETQVVVATIQKLGHCVGSPDYEWLKSTCIVIDEAHAATEKSYTEVLGWQGVGRGKERCPVIGLTATPFRGRSEEETDRLVKRFGGVRLDKKLTDDPYRHLQELGVLARVKHALLGGIQVDLSQKERAAVDQFGRLPSSVSDKIAGSVDRNATLVKDLLKRPRDWPMIVFAASVEHAQALAALLRMEGVSAAPISATTDSGTRRHYIERFREGRIQVLTNYAVLAQGFDAPAVRAIYVARPTFSPALYQQMIGRGLRGPRNGGKEECLIVNIEDNFAKYGTMLAFREFEHLWTRSV